MYGLLSTQSPDLLTWMGRVIVHHNRAQMEWLHPGARVVEVPDWVPAAHTIPIQQHPDYDGAFDFNGDVDPRRFRDAS